MKNLASTLEIDGLKARFAKEQMAKCHDKVSEQHLLQRCWYDKTCILHCRVVTRDVYSPLDAPGCLRV